jgi:nucleoside-diphosphate-sugar epimerase
VAGRNIYLRKLLNPRRDNIYLDDAISGLLKVALSGSTCEAYNISSNGELGNFLAVDEIARIIVDEANRRFGSMRKTITISAECANTGSRKPGLLLDNSKLKELGWTLSTSINDGIVKTLDSVIARSF